MGKVAINILVQAFVWRQIFNFFGYILSTIAGLYDKSIFSFVRVYQLSSKITVPFLPVLNESFDFSISQLTLGWSFCYSHPSSNISWFWFAFSQMAYDSEHLFMWLFIFFKECLFRFFGLFLIGLFIFELQGLFVYILNSSSLSDMYFVKISSQFLC